MLRMATYTTSSKYNGEHARLGSSSNTMANLFLNNDIKSIDKKFEGLTRAKAVILDNKKQRK